MIDADRLRRGYETAARTLLDEATPQGHWTGELSPSPLSTATAIAALHLVGQNQPARVSEFSGLIDNGLNWLTATQNADGGWGDTTLSHSNISTATLAYASFHMVCGARNSQTAAASEGGSSSGYEQVMSRAKSYMDQHGGFDAIRKRYGKDHTFSVPILTQCALAELIPWKELTPLPFELGWLPHSFYQVVTLPVVSYALPALIAIGQVRHHHAPSWNPFIRGIRQLAVQPTLRRLIDLQPESGGFLEATPLTSFVTMSLASMGQSDHPVARLGVDFIKASVRSDGSWPIDTNLATWVTTLSVNALRPGALGSVQAKAIADWILNQQHREVHRYTNAAPGGWAWTDLTGGVPDADDTPGAILALLKLNVASPRVAEALAAAIEWLLNLQNRDGGWPTFCRGWGALPFDRSAADLTAHALRAIRAWQASPTSTTVPKLVERCNSAVRNGFRFLERTQRSNGTWLPLWFGNQYAPDDENPVYGVSRALAAFRDWDRQTDAAARKAVQWLVSVQNPDGGWGGDRSTPSSTEETALAVDALAALPEFSESWWRGVDWLLDQVEAGRFRNPSPIGLYFAKLWYFERLYPIIFTVAALGRAVDRVAASEPATGQ